jgi:hypothetical protein
MIQPGSPGRRSSRLLRQLLRHKEMTTIFRSPAYFAQPRPDSLAPVQAVPFIIPPAPDAVFENEQNRSAAGSPSLPLINLSAAQKETVDPEPGPNKGNAPVYRRGSSEHGPTPQPVASALPYSPTTSSQPFASEIQRYPIEPALPGIPESRYAPQLDTPASGISSEAATPPAAEPGATPTFTSEAAPLTAADPGAEFPDVPRPPSSDMQAVPTPTASGTDPQIQPEKPVLQSEGGAGKSTQTKTNDADWARLQNIFRKHQEKARTGLTESANAPPEAAEIQREDQAVPRDEVQPEMEQTNPPRINSPSVEPLSARQSDRPVQTRHDSIPGDLSSPAAPDHQEIPADIYGERDDLPGTDKDLQAVPLEVSWPVQRRSVESFTQPENRKDDPLSPDDPLPPPSFVERLQGQVRRALQSITPDRPSSSSVEVITPRRDRPTTASTVQRSPQQAIPASSSHAGMDQSQDSPAPAKTGWDHNVETQIGPLPADLWRLIGERPPQVHTQEDQALDPASPGATPGPLITPDLSASPPGFKPSHASVQTAGREINTDETQSGVLSSLAREARSTSVSTGANDSIESWDIPDSGPNNQTPVQRAPDGSSSRISTPEPASGRSTSSSAVSEEAASVSEEPPGQAETELDMDELAERVYSDIRRRLAIELERHRHR